VIWGLVRESRNGDDGKWVGLTLGGSRSDAFEKLAEKAAGLRIFTT